MMDRTIDPEWIKRIVALVLEQVGREGLAPRQEAGPSRNLVLFSGSTPGFEDALDSLERLRRDGYNFRVVLTESARHILDVEKITAKLQPEAVLNASEVVPGRLAMETDLLILPTATINMVAKLCAFMTDTMPLAYVLRVLMLRRRLVMAVNGCCPTRMERLYHTEMPPAMKEGMSSNLAKLESFGAELCSARRIDETVLGEADPETVALSRLAAAQVAPPVTITPVAAAAPAVVTSPAAMTAVAAVPEARIAHKVISREDVMGCPANSRVLIRPDALVTNLAAEAADHYGIELVRA